MSVGNTYNQTSLDIANDQYRASRRRASFTTRQKWHEEFISSGAQFRMSWLDYENCRSKEKNKIEEQRDWQFGGGKYDTKKIKDVLVVDLPWINEMLTNSPKGKLARQIVLYCRYNNIVLAAIEFNPKLKNLPNPKQKKKR